MSGQRVRWAHLTGDCHSTALSIPKKNKAGRTRQLLLAPGSQQGSINHQQVMPPGWLFTHNLIISRKEIRLAWQAHLLQSDFFFFFFFLKVGSVALGDTRLQ